MTIELGVMLPTSTPDPNQPILGDIAASARLAEDLGLDSIWATDHLIASAPMLDSSVVLATAAAVTERITIGYNVLLLALRPAAWAAKQIATLQYVSGDRLVVGVGTGNPAHGDVGWRAAGQPFAGRGRRTDEALRILPDLVAGRTVAAEDGLEVTLSPGATMPPVLVAGSGAAALRRTATFGDGWVTIASTPDEVHDGLATVTSLATERSRPTPAATVVAPGLDADPGAAADQLAAYAEAGTERVILPPTGNLRADYQQAARLRAALH